MSASPPDPRLGPVCDLLAGQQGEPLLRLMFDMYLSRGDPAEVPSVPMTQAHELGLLEWNGARLVPTSLGYLIGNVAKEYCHWLDHGRRMPPPRPPEWAVSGTDVLDVGCGFGRWLWEFQKTARSVLGVEMQTEYIQLGEALARREGVRPPPIRQGSAEDIERLVPAAAFDLCFSRLMFNHVWIRPTLAKVAATLRPGGMLWLEVEPVSGPLRALLGGERRLRSRARAAFGVLNTLACMATGRQVRLRTAGRQHREHKPAYPTLEWWRRSLAAASFTDFHSESASGSLAFWARKEG